MINDLFVELDHLVLDQATRITGDDGFEIFQSTADPFVEDILL